MPVDFLLDHLVLIYFVYGLSFFVMGLVVALEARRADVLYLARSLRYLAAFGLVHSLVEWGEMFLLIAGGGRQFARSEVVELAILVLLVVSTSLLSLFGGTLIAKTKPRLSWLTWAAPALLVAWFLGVGFASALHPVLSQEWLSMASVWARYIIYVPASAMAAAAFFMQGGIFERLSIPRLVGDTRWAGIAFAVNAVLAGVVAPPVGRLPESMLHYVFLPDIGIPAQILRALSALAIALSVGRILRLFEIENRRQLERANQQRFEAQQVALETQRLAQEKSKQWGRELEQRISERTSELERRNRELAAMNAVAGTVSKSLDIDHILQGTLETVISVTGMEAGAIFLLNEWGDRLVLHAHYGLTPEVVAELKAPPAELDSESLHRSGWPTPETMEDSPVCHRRFIRLPEGPEGRSQSVVGIPLQVKGKTLGVMDIAARGETHLGRRDLELLTAIGQQIAVAIDNAQLFQETERRERESEALLRVSTDISGLAGIETVLSSVVEKAAQLVGADVAALSLVDSQAGCAYMKATAGVHTERLKHLRLDLGLGVTGLVAQTGASLALEDYLTDRRIEHDPEGDAAVADEGLRSLAAVPLRVGERVIGVLLVGNRRIHQFSKDNCRLLSGLANQAAIALENARLYQEVQSYAIHEERDRIAREMHDGLAQVLGYFNVQTKNLELLIDAGKLDHAKQELKEMNRAAQDAYTDVRESILGLRTSISPDQAFVPTLCEYIEKFSRLNQLNVDLRCGRGLDRVSPAAEVQLMRIVQEALTNVRKHARASAVSVAIEEHGGESTITIEDNGVGFDLSSVLAGDCEQFGLRTMKERAESIGARLIVQSTPGVGTKVAVTMPLGNEGGVYVGTIEDHAGG